jgi:uncharacterized protein YdbL (DUF1318 family)
VREDTIFMKHARIIIATMLSLVFVASVAPTPAMAADRKSELQQKFKERYPELQRLRTAGKVGETSVGTVEAVSGGLDASGQKAVDAENADRGELYQLLAKELGTTAEKVAHINGARRIKEMRAGEYYKDDDGNWNKKGG